MMEKSAAREVTKELLRAVNFRGVIQGKLPMTPAEFFREQQDLDGICHVLLRPEFFTRAELRQYCGMLLSKAGEHLGYVDMGVTSRIHSAIIDLKDGSEIEEADFERLVEAQDDEIARCWIERTSRHSAAWHWLEATVKASLHPFSPYSARNCTRVLLQFFHRNDDALASLREVLRWRVEGERGESSSS